MSASRPDDRLDRESAAPPARTAATGPERMPDVKICGCRSAADARAAVEAGATHVGVVFADGPRRVSPEEATGIVAAAGGRARPVGVFVDPDPTEVLEIARRVGLAVVQLHGEEPPATCEALRAAGLEVWKAVRPRSATALEAAAGRYGGSVDALLVEGWSPERAGGTGTGLPLAWLEGWRERLDLGEARLVLAGGLRPGTVGRAVARVGPDVVDVSSGVERRPGEKDPERIRAFVRAARGSARGAGGMGGTDATGEARRPGWFGSYGGRFVPETLIPALDELETAWREAREDEAFRRELDALLADYAGRPTPLYRAGRLGEELGGVRVWLKREDLNHTGAHKINNTVGQALLARRMGKRRIIAETGAGQHGVATATACALFGFECAVYMGEEDMRRQALNVERMRLLGAEVRPVTSGSRTLKDATNEAIRDWVTNVDTTHYVIGSVVGPAPYPAMVRDLQRVIGDEAIRQMEERGRRTAAVYACVGGGSNAIGIFTAFLEADEEGEEEERVQLVGVEAAGEGIASGRHAASLAAGTPGVLHGNYSYLLQDEGGQVVPAHSASAGLDYPGVGPEHAWLRDTGRVRYESVTDGEALAAFQDLCRLEGIIPALESAHALARLRLEAERWSGRDVLVCLSGRGDKDVAEVARLLGE